MTSLPGAASTSLRAVLSGPVRTGRVAGVHQTCAYVVTGPGRPQLVALESADAVGLPCAVRLGVDRDAAPFGDVRPGDLARVGDGAVTAGPLSVRVARWWRPPTVRRPRSVTGPASRPVATLAALLADRPAPVADDLDPDELVGLGPGLTPAGDDVVAGALLAVHHDPPLRDPLAAAVHRLAGRTTALSAALLAEAASGHGVPAAVALADVLSGPADEEAVTGCLDRLLRVGHTSGLALAHGLLRGARRVAASAAERGEGTAA